MERNELIAIWIALVCILIALVGWLVEINRKKERAEEYKKSEKPKPPAPIPPKPSAPKPTTVAEAVVDAVTDIRSEDEKYADGHNMWICKYCETFNPYPPGMRKAEKESPTPVATPVLRGDLVKKKNAYHNPAAEKMVCVACGKQR